MKKIKVMIGITIFFSLILSSCENSKIKNLDNSTEESSNFNEEPEPLKQIEWKDGKIYSYNYTEIITTKDSSGNEIEITVYKSDKPKESDIICDKKICKWCSKEMYADNYEIEEYPNIKCLTAAPDFSCIIGLFTSIFDGTHFYDIDNNKVRTEWRINCNYPGPDGFCSLKCENEYKYR